MICENCGQELRVYSATIRDSGNAHEYCHRCARLSLAGYFHELEADARNNDGSHWTMHRITTLAARAGSHYFEPDTMRFFRSKLYGAHDGPGGVFFVTSEQFEGGDGRREPRRYSVRRFAWWIGEIEDASMFQEFDTLPQARRFADRMAEGMSADEARSDHRRGDKSSARKLEALSGA